MTGLTPWRSRGLESRLENWIHSNNPSIDLVAIVIAWARVQMDDPYVGAVRNTDPGPNYWWARVPGTHFNDTDVMCGYFVDEQQREVRWDTIGTLRRPNNY